MLLLRSSSSLRFVLAVVVVVAWLPSMTLARVLTDEQLEDFTRDGFLYVPKFFDGEALAQLVNAGNAVTDLVSNNMQYRTFSVIEKGIMFGMDDGSSSGSPEQACLDVAQTFRQTAVHSKLAQASAELMQLDEKTQNVRILRDVFLAKPVNETEICNWHVDDQGFWPAQYRSTASDLSGKDQHGINVWIALDDMPYEGSMALAPKSHRADWNQRAYAAIGQDRDNDTPMSREFVIQLLAKSTTPSNGTCTMDQSDPELQAQIDATKVVMNYQQGDVVFCTRLLFHRTLQVTPEGLDYYASIGKKTLNRYSIRYVPGTTKLPDGFSFFEYSTLTNPDNMGQSLNEIAVQDQALWYPQVWPVLDDQLERRMDEVARTHLPHAKELQVEVRKSFFADIQAAKAKQASVHVDETKVAFK